MSKRNGIGSHQSAKMINDEWLTPPHILKPLGQFDLDPCSPIVRPWPTARQHYTKIDDGLVQPWHGRVWLNPPYGRSLVKWLEKMSQHANGGICLTFARTETFAFQNYVFGKAESILFIKGRITFCDVHGNPGKFNGGAPSMLAAYGEMNSEVLAECGIEGRHVPVNTVPVIIVGISPSWKSVVTIAMARNNGTATVDEIYRLVEMIAPDKVQKNPHFKQKIRQKLQYHFERLSKGVYSLKDKEASQSIEE